MALYFMNEAVLDLPELGFVDSTIHGLEAPLPNEKTLGVLVHRRPVENGATLRTLVDENVALNQKRLRSFIVESEREALVGGLPGILSCARWRNEQRENVQLQAHVVVEQTWMIFAVSAPLEERRACEETFSAMLETLVFNQRLE